jgi:hypothetical protein
LKDDPVLAMALKERARIKTSAGARVSPGFQMESIHHSEPAG